MELNKLTENELIFLRVEIEWEMRSRGICFSVGEFGETLAINFYNSTPGLSNLMAVPRDVKNVDAISRDGDRYSIKTIQKAKKNGDHLS